MVIFAHEEEEEEEGGEEEETQDGVVYLASDDRVLDIEIEKNKVTAMTRKQRQIVNGGIDKVNQQTKAMNRCLVTKTNGRFGVFATWARRGHEHGRNRYEL